MTKKILLDTNILIYLTDFNSPFYLSNPDKIFKNYEIFISDRTLLEFYRVATSYLKYTPQQACDIVNFYINALDYNIVYSDFNSINLTFDMAKEEKAKSGKVFDLNILAVAIENEIDILYTKNIKDYPENKLIQIIDPTL